MTTSAHAPAPAEAVVRQVDDRLDTALRAAIPSGPVALLNIPTHTNVGDHAITLGELAWLRRAGHEIVYTCALDDYSPARLAERIGTGSILLHGGGNLGDLWPHHQRFRENVLAQFPGHKVVQLPQSIKFSSQDNLDTARRAFAGHPDFTLLLRDGAAYEFAQEQFDCPSALSPDSACALGPLTRRCQADTDILVLGRTDHESDTRLDQELGEDTLYVDWLGNTSRRFDALRRIIALGGPAARKTRASHALGAPILRRSYEALARDRLELGLSLLSRARVVVTDRLHAHILCTLLRIPHVICDTGYGKVGGYHRAWTAEAGVATVADTPDEALAVARDWVSAA